MQQQNEKELQRFYANFSRSDGKLATGQISPEKDEMEKVARDAYLSYARAHQPALLLTGVATAQTSNKAEQVPGYYNPKTHTFQVKVQPEVDPDAAAPKTYTGTLKYEISVKLVTPVATGEELVCSANA